MEIAFDITAIPLTSTFSWIAHSTSFLPNCRIWKGCRSSAPTLVQWQAVPSFLYTGLFYLSCRRRTGKYF